MAQYDDLRHGNGKLMPNITTKNGSVVLRDGKAELNGGCCCPACSANYCSFLVVSGVATQMGDCPAQSQCCCIRDPRACLEPQYFDEDGNPTLPFPEIPSRGYCVKLCSGAGLFIWADPQAVGDQPDIAAEWLDNVKTWMLDHGWTFPDDTINLPCFEAKNPPVTHYSVWMRACCDGDYDPDDCLYLYGDVAPPNNFFPIEALLQSNCGFVAWNGGGCQGAIPGLYIPACIPNPLP